MEELFEGFLDIFLQFDGIEGFPQSYKVSFPCPVFHLFHDSIIWGSGFVVLFSRFAGDRITLL